MNLREQIEKEITEKVMVKLASEKVELANIQDLLKFEKGVRVFGKNIDISIKEIETNLNSLKVDVEDLQSDYNKAKKGIDTAEKMAKELGLNASQIPKYKEAKEALKYGDVQIKKAKKYI